jgi:hypothetical protein
MTAASFYLDRKPAFRRASHCGAVAMAICRVISSRTCRPLPLPQEIHTVTVSRTMAGSAAPEVLSTQYGTANAPTAPRADASELTRDVALVHGGPSQPVSRYRRADLLCRVIG